MLILLSFGQVKEQIKHFDDTSKKKCGKMMVKVWLLEEKEDEC
jgi:hypothetical protein